MKKFLHKISHKLKKIISHSSDIYEQQTSTSFHTKKTPFFYKQYDST